jgi:antitoxin ParD1/3/4
MSDNICSKKNKSRIFWTWKVDHGCAIREQKEIEMTEIHLSEQDQAFIDDLVDAGVYKNADAVVSAALRLMGSEEGKIVELQRLIQVGLDDVAAGRVHHYASGDELLKDIKRMAAESKSKTGTGY